MLRLNGAEEKDKWKYKFQSLPSSSPGVKVTETWKIRERERYKKKTTKIMQLKVLKQWLFLFLCFVFFLSHEAEHFISNCVLPKSREEERRRRWKAEGRRPANGDGWSLNPAVRPPSEVRGLTQAGDVGLPTRGCYDALGGAAGNVVVNLSSCWINNIRIDVHVLKTSYW